MRVGIFVKPLHCLLLVVRLLDPGALCALKLLLHQFLLVDMAQVLDPQLIHIGCNLLCQTGGLRFLPVLIFGRLRAFPETSCIVRLELRPRAGVNTGTRVLQLEISNHGRVQNIQQQQSRACMCIYSSELTDCQYPLPGTPSPEDQPYDSDSQQDCQDLQNRCKELQLWIAQFGDENHLDAVLLGDLGACEDQGCGRGQLGQAQDKGQLGGISECRALLEEIRQDYQSQHDRMMKEIGKKERQIIKQRQRQQKTMSRNGTNVIDLDKSSQGKNNQVCPNSCMLNINSELHKNQLGQTSLDIQRLSCQIAKYQQKSEQNKREIEKQELLLQQLQEENKKLALKQVILQKQMKEKQNKQTMKSHPVRIRFRRQPLEPVVKFIAEEKTSLFRLKHESQILQLEIRRAQKKLENIKERRHNQYHPQKELAIIHQQKQRRERANLKFIVNETTLRNLQAKCNEMLDSIEKTKKQIKARMKEAKETVHNIRARIAVATGSLERRKQRVKEAKALLSEYMKQYPQHEEEKKIAKLKIKSLKKKQFNQLQSSSNSVLSNPSPLTFSTPIQTQKSPHRRKHILSVISILILSIVLIFYFLI